MKALTTLPLIALVLTFAGCSDSPSPTRVSTTPAVLGPPVVSQEVSISTLSNFDLGVFDPVASRYYAADLGSKQIDIVNLAGTLGTPLVTGSFSGSAGPDGIVYVPGTTPLLYVGDLNSVKIVDPAKNALVNTVTITTAGVRADEGCYDQDDSIVLYASPEGTPPFVTFISTKTQSVIGKYVFSADTTGLEACVYDSGSKSFLINNDGTNANPAGEVDVMTAASVVAATPVIAKVFPTPGCGPTGIALGPNTDVLIGCRQTPPMPTLFSYILNRTTGAILATPAAGGVDQVAYDPATNRYFLPAFFNQANGVPGGLGTTAPVLDVVDASTRSVIYQVPMGFIGHAISVDSTDGKLFIPHRGATATQGTAFPNPGVTIFTTH